MDHSADQLERLSREKEPESSRWEELDLKEFLSILYRRKWLIVGTVIIITGLAALFAFTATPEYTANLQLVFDATEQKVINFDAAMSGQPQDEAALLSEIEVIQSRALAGRVIDKLGLENDPEFNTDLAPSGFLGRFLSGGEPAAEQPAPADGATSDEVASWEKEVAALTRERVIDNVLERIEVTQSGRSRAVEVDFTSVDPVKSAVIANTIGELFLLERLEGKFENARRASEWLADHVQKLRQQVEEAESRAEDYRKNHDLLQGERVTLITEQISTLNAQLSEARRARTDAEANLAQANRLLSSPDKLNTAVQVLESDLIQRLREQQSALARREAALTQELGPMHPQILQLREERAKLFADVDAEVRKVIASLENKVDVARRQEALIVDELNALKGQMALANEASVGLHAIERDAEANRLMLEKFMTAFMETSAQEDASAQLPDARVISTAAVPEEPSFPNKPLIVAGGFAFSVLCALLLALSLERLDSGFRSADQVESATGLHVVAHVPLVTGGKGAVPADYILSRPDSAFGEAIRSLFTRLLLASASAPPKVLLITSSEPGEGKTSVSLALARMQARAGRKVVLVDADFRKSTISDLLKVEASPGLLEVMNGAASVEEATRTDEATGLDVVVSGAYHSEALHAFATGRIDSVLEDLRSRYDFVIIDSAPVLVISDAQILSSKADETLLVVRWGATRREVATYAARQLKSTARRVGGAILSQVDVTKQARYNYGDSGYYFGKAKRYYTT
jgi:succinoglycan biosynthesis transport protein ExoP